MYFGHVDGGKAEGGKLWRGIVDGGGGGGGGAGGGAKLVDVEGEDEVIMVDVVTASGQEGVASSGNAEDEADADCRTDVGCSL